MNTIEIPMATLGQKALIIVVCAFVIVTIGAWTLPRFKLFLNFAFNGVGNESKKKTSHLFFGFIVYGFIFALELIALVTGVLLATARPTVLSPEGITGIDFSCSSDLRLFPLSCSSSPSSWVDSRHRIEWSEIEKVSCVSRPDGTVRELYIKAGAKRISIGSLALHDLSRVRRLILAQAPSGVGASCN